MIATLRGHSISAVFASRCVWTDRFFFAAIIPQLLENYHISHAESRSTNNGSHLPYTSPIAATSLCIVCHTTREPTKCGPLSERYDKILFILTHWKCILTQLTSGTRVHACPRAVLQWRTHENYFLNYLFLPVSARNSQALFSNGDRSFFPHLFPPIHLPCITLRVTDTEIFRTIKLPPTNKSPNANKIFVAALKYNRGTLSCPMGHISNH